MYENFRNRGLFYDAGNFNNVKLSNAISKVLDRLYSQEKSYRWAIFIKDFKTISAIA